MSYLRLNKRQKAKPEDQPPRERIESGFTALEKDKNGRPCFNNRPEPETMRLRMTRDEVTRVQPIIITHPGKTERTREYGFFDQARGLWVCYRMTRQGGVVRYDLTNLGNVEIEPGKDIRA